MTKRVLRAHTWACSKMRCAILNKCMAIFRLNKKNILSKERVSERIMLFSSEVAIGGTVNVSIESSIWPTIKIAPMKNSEENDFLYSYELKLSCPSNQPRFWTMAEYKLINLFSLYFQARFYITEIRNIECPSKKIHFHYHKCDSIYCSSIFSNKNREFNQALINWIKGTLTLLETDQERLNNACFRYCKALRYVGVDTELVFVHLVSAVESLLEPTSELHGKNFDDIINTECPENIKNELKNFLRVKDGKILYEKAITKAFVKLIKDNTQEYLRTKWEDLKSQGFIEENKPLFILEDNLERVLKTIYHARSKFLHEGTYMFNDQYVELEYDPHWDFSGHPSNKDLPYVRPFEQLVRESILVWIQKKLNVSSASRN